MYVLYMFPDLDHVDRALGWPNKHLFGPAKFVHG